MILGCSAPQNHQTALVFRSKCVSPKWIREEKITSILRAFLLTVGQYHEAVMFKPLMEQGAVKRARPDRPRLCPERVVGAQGYTDEVNNLAILTTAAIML